MFGGWTVLLRDEELTSRYNLLNSSAILLRSIFSFPSDEIVFMYAEQLFVFRSTSDFLNSSQVLCIYDFEPPAVLRQF